MSEQRRGLGDACVLAVPAEYAGASSGSGDHPQQYYLHRLKLTTRPSAYATSASLGQMHGRAPCARQANTKTHQGTPHAPIVPQISIPPSLARHHQVCANTVHPTPWHRQGAARRLPASAVRGGSVQTTRDAQGVRQTHIAVYQTARHAHRARWGASLQMVVRV